MLFAIVMATLALSICLAFSCMRSGRRQLQLFAESVTCHSGHSGQDVIAAGLGTNIPVGSALQQSSPSGAGKLWLCLYFPLLSLKAVADANGCSTQRPAVVVEQGSQSIVMATDSGAYAAGIRSGMALNAALALLPELEVYARDEEAEQRLLNGLAQWALGFTPVVSCVNHGLLLEVRGSLNLFGGLKKLAASLIEKLQACDQQVRVAYAPTARAALWLVHASQSQYIHGCYALTDLPALLAALPLHCLGWPDAVQKKLHQMGVSNLGECLRLPRDGFARRIGSRYLQELDQGLGRYPDVRSYFQAPVRFQARLELASETVQMGPIINLCQELLAQLGAFMRQRQQGMQQLDVQLLHYQHPPTALTVTTRDVDTQVGYLFDLLCLRFDRLSLKRPVTGVRLSAEMLTLCSSPSGNLFDSPVDESNERQSHYLLERLRARLGAVQVHFIQQVAEHRPERAWRAIAQPGIHVMEEYPGELVHRPRPIWLLAEPRRLSAVGEQPVWQGKLTFLSDAERIESGWWDGGDIRRDYYAVAGQAGAHGWVFRDCRSFAWYLHGIFA